MYHLWHNEALHKYDPVLINYKELARLKAIGYMFIMKGISHLVTNNLSSVYLRIDVGMRMPVNPNIDAAVGYKFTKLRGKCTIQKRNLCDEVQLPSTSEGDALLPQCVSLCSLPSCV